jgi:hypothetical protein
MAHADSIASTIFLQQLNQWSDNFGESLGTDGGAIGVLQVGDTLRGTFEIETIEDRTGGGGTVQYSNAIVNELTGIFEITVTGATIVSDPDGIPFNGSAGERANYTFGPTASFIAEFGLVAGAMVAFFEDAAPGDYDRTGTIAQAETSATGGTLVMQIGLSGLDPDEQWAASNAPTNVANLANIPPPTTLGTFDFGLAILFNTLFPNFTQVDAPCVIFGTCGVGGNGLVDISGTGTIQGSRGTDTEYDGTGNIDLFFRPIPEPGTLGMLGIGLLGLGVFMRTRQKHAV